MGNRVVVGHRNLPFFGPFKCVIKIQNPLLRAGFNFHVTILPSPRFQCQAYFNKFQSAWVVILKLPCYTKPMKGGVSHDRDQQYLRRTPENRPHRRRTFAGSPRRGAQRRTHHHQQGHDLQVGKRPRAPILRQSSPHRRIFPALAGLFRRHRPRHPRRRRRRAPHKAPATPSPRPPTPCISRQRI